MPPATLHAFPPVFDLQDCRYGRMLFPRQDQYVGRSLAFYGEFSEGEVDLFRHFLEPGQVVVDVGANLGAHTVVFARMVGPTGLVLAFEPQRILHQALCANLALNGIPNVIAEQVGLGRTPGTAFIPPLDYGQALNFGGLSLDQAAQGEAVPVRTLDAYGLQSCAFLKIDVEGMEAAVLAGGATTVRRLRPILYVENDRRERSAELIGLLLGWGYRLWWHVPPLFNPANFRGQGENIFPDLGSRNLLALPQERPIAIQGLPPIASALDWPFPD